MTEQEFKMELFARVRRGDAEDQEWLVSQPPSSWPTVVSLRDFKGRTPLMLAAWFGHRKLMSCLAEMGASILDEDNDGTTGQDYMQDFARGKVVEQHKEGLRLSWILKELRGEFSSAPDEVPPAPGDLVSSSPEADLRGIKETPKSNKRL